jgi:hypothetical protein
MKDIYELLNDINIDENEFEEMEVSEFEKTNVKKALKNSIHKNNKMKAWKKSIVAASVLVGLSVTSLITLPAYAGSIPVINDIFRFFDIGTTEQYGAEKENSNKSNNTKETGLYYDYKKFSNEVNITTESNGIKFTINDAVFDGKTATITYTIESEQELDNAGISLPNIEGMGAMGGTGITTKIDKNKYVGLLTASNMENKNLDVANITWHIDSIRNPATQTDIKGDWKFSFSVNATESKVNLLSNASSDKNGVKVNVEKISITPMSFTVYYNQEISEMLRNTWDGVQVDLEIKDDLGNIYSGQGNGGVGIVEDGSMSLSKTFEKLDKKATKLIITPHVLRNYTSDTAKPSTGKEQFVLDEIIIELNN